MSLEHSVVTGFFETAIQPNNQLAKSSRMYREHTIDMGGGWVWVKFL